MTSPARTSSPLKYRWMKVIGLREQHASSTPNGTRLKLPGFPLCGAGENFGQSLCRLQKERVSRVSLSRRSDRHLEQQTWILVCDCQERTRWARWHTTALL